MSHYPDKDYTFTISNTLPSTQNFIPPIALNHNHPTYPKCFHTPPQSNEIQRLELFFFFVHVERVRDSQNSIKPFWRFAN